MFAGINHIYIEIQRDVSTSPVAERAKNTNF